MIGAIIQARMSSSRLPGKVLMPLAGESVLSHVVTRVQAIRGLEKTVVATSIEPEDDAIATLCEEKGFICSRGSRDDVLSRYFEAAQHHMLEPIVRITADCPLIDPVVVSELLEEFRAGDYDYMSNCVPGPRTFPRGLDCEVFTFSALRRAHEHAKERREREHVTPYIHENKNGEFRIGTSLKAEDLYKRPQYRLTLDCAEDYALFERLYGHFYRKNGLISVSEVLTYLDAHPEVVAINAAREAEYSRLEALL